MRSIINTLCMIYCCLPCFKEEKNDKNINENDIEIKK